jgi:histone deacetylase complex regulatory component SIN3
LCNCGTGFAQAYFLKLKGRLEGTELYQEFLNIMNEFGTSIVDVSDLYKKITAILKHHPDLSEEFLAFLLPEQAMQCGKFMEYLMITKMRDFFRKLEVCK